jgi:hypothetical protein
MRTVIKASLAAGMVLWVGVGVAGAAEEAAYVGTKMCMMCHKKPENGDQAGKWQASGHAKSFEVLGSAEAKAVGAKVGVDDPQKSGKCLKCHATAYAGTEGVKSEKVAVADGVSCESCHGAGANYKAMAVMKDKAKAVAAGMVDPATKSCAQCHNEQSPTWKDDRYTTKDGKKVGFDVEQASEKIKHSNPNAKK